MSDGAHLLIPSAASGAPGCREALRTLALPHLERLLARLRPAETEGDDEATRLSMPHEAALARECGLPAPDGRLPWAAWELAQAGRDPGTEACAWITPCHWQVGTSHVVMRPPQQLQLDAPDSQALMAAMAPYFEQDGLRLEFEAPTRWLARGALFGQIACASLDRVAGRVIDPWMPRADAARPLRRLQQEMQMLLYTHPVNDARTRAGLVPVNSFWASGTGALPSPRPAGPPAGLHLTHALRDAALLEEWGAWAAAWQQLDARDCAGLLARLDAGEPVAVTLGGDRRARTWRSAGAGWGLRLKSMLSRPSAAELLSDL